MQEFIWKTMARQGNRSPDWYWAVGLITIIGGIGAIFWGNILFGLFIILAGGMLFYLNLRPEPELLIKVSEKEIAIGKINYVPSKMKGFAIVKNHNDQDIMIIHTGRFFMPLISVVIPENIDLLALGDVLEKKIKREDLKETPATVLADKLGF